MTLTVSNPLRHGWDLVDAAQAGDLEAFGVIYRAHFPAVFGLLMQSTQDAYRAEELASETFLRALRQIKTLSYQGKPIRAWLMTIAKNLARDDRKSGRTRFEVVGAVYRERALVDLDPAVIACSRAVAAELSRSMRELTADQRRCLVLRFIEGMSVAETAKLMGRKPVAVRALQLRATRKLALAVPPSLARDCA